MIPSLCNLVLWKDSFSERHWCTWTQHGHGAELGISWLQGWLIRKPWKLWARKLAIIICFYSTPGNKSLGTPSVKKQAYTNVQTASLLSRNSMARPLILDIFLGHRTAIPGLVTAPSSPNFHQDLHSSVQLPAAVVQLNRIEITNHTISGNNGRPQAPWLQASSIYTDDKCPLELLLKRPVLEFSSERTGSLKICSFFWSPTEVRTAWCLGVLQWKECNHLLQGGE